MQTTTHQQEFFCRSCYSYQQKDKHSLKQCLTDKRNCLQAIEDRKFEREVFIKNNKARIISKKAITTPEIAVKPPQIVENQLKTSKKSQAIAAIFKRPRVLRRRKIAPVVRQWSCTSSSDPNKNQQSTLLKKPVVYSTQNSEAAPYNQLELPQFGGNKNSSTHELTPPIQ